MVRVLLLKKHALILIVAASLVSLLPAPGSGPSANGDVKSVEQYRQFATLRDGEAARGQKLFADEQRLGCTKCHSLDGRGTKAGPDLLTVGNQFTRRDLIEAVLVPSATIAVGYSMTVVETKSEDEYQGVLKQATDDWIELAGADSQRIRIPTSDIKERRGSNISLMPEGLQAALSLQEFTDLIDYLVSLKQPANSRISYRGMPDLIPQLTKPVALRPLFSEELRFPYSVVRSPGDVLSGLVGFEPVPGFSNVFLVIHQSGKIWRLEKNGQCDTRSVFVDLTPEVFSVRGPNGLLGFAFHPKFRENRKYYLKYQVFEDGKIATILAERLAAPDFKTDSGQPSVRLLKIVAVAEHHNGGCIRFGPDGFLYFGMGDSAPNNDPQGHGQELRLLFGKMLRIDVDHHDPKLSYAIPAGNPFRDRTGARPEIWAYGLREPWRFSFDRLTGDLWVADLGQERGDEVDIVRPGENHGWNVYEGFEPFSNQHRKEGVVYVPPIFSSRPKHGNTVIGGHVYRGDPHSSFYGVYIFGDYTSKRIWGLTQVDRTLKAIRQIATAPEPITSFSTDAQGNIYAVGYEGMIYRLDLACATFETGHTFACADYTQGKVFVIGADGRVELEYSAPGCDELWVLPNGNLLFTTGHGVKELTRQKKVVFSYESKSEIYACQRLPNGNTFIGECNSGRLLEVEPSGNIAKEVRLLPESKNGGHLYMRNARRLPNGHYLVAHYADQVVREYDGNGETVREFAAPGGPHSVVRLPNGHTLIACGDLPSDGARVFEADREGKKVWEISSRDLPGISLKLMTGFQRLPNGNTVMSNWQGHGQLGSGPHLIEVTHDKRVVWTFADHQKLKTVSTVQLLDVPGDAIAGEVWH